MERINQISVTRILHHSHVISRFNIDICRKLLDKIKRMTAVLNERSRDHVACVKKGKKVKGHSSRHRKQDGDKCPRKKSKRRTLKFHNTFISQVFISIFHRKSQFLSLKFVHSLVVLVHCKLRCWIYYQAKEAQPIWFLVRRNVEKQYSTLKCTCVTMCVAHIQFPAQLQTCLQRHGPQLLPRYFWARIVDVETILRQHFSCTHQHQNSHFKFPCCDQN